MSTPSIFDVERKSEPRGTSMARRFVLAGLAGSVLGVAAAFSGTLGGLPLLAHIVVALTLACGAVVALSPWRLLRQALAEQAALEDLLRRAQRFADDARSMRLEELLLDRADAIGDLSKSIHELASETISTRRHSRLLQRRLNEDVKRETQRATAHLARQATTDPLTGLGNRRAFDHALELYIGSAASRGSTLTIMLIDLDRFKEVNDTLGHEVGDGCLVFLAHLLRGSLHDGDCAIRLGGDEFVVFMPQGTIEAAQGLAGRLSSLYAQMPWSHLRVDRPTLSIGLASGRVGDVSDPDELLRQADAALYASKRAGRGRVRCHPSACVA